MSKQIIIELNQNDTNNTEVFNSGDYSTSLKKPVIIEKGDQIELKSVFLDTRVANSRKIKVRGDIQPNGEEGQFGTITMEVGYYKSDVLGTFEKIPSLTTTNYTESAPALLATEKGSFTGKPFPAFVAQTASHSAFLNITSITFEYNINEANNRTLNVDVTLPNLPKFTKHFTFNWAAGFEKLNNQYIEVNEDTGLSSVTVDTSNFLAMQTSGHFTTNVKSFPFYAPDPTQLVPPQSIDKIYVQNNQADGAGVLSVSTEAHNETNDIYHLYTNTVSLQLEARLYDADDIAEKINQKVTDLGYGGVGGAQSYRITDNPMLRTVQQIRIDEGIELQFIDIDTEFRTLNQGKKRKFFYDTGDGTTPSFNKLNYLIGSSQFGLTYNSVQDKMEILKLHNSLLSGKFFDNTDTSQTEQMGTAVEATQNPEVRIIKNTHFGQPALDKKYLVNKNSGVFFTSLKPDYLWFDEFKFDRNIVVGTETQKMNFATDIGDRITVIAPSPLIEKQNITADESGLDELIVKSLNIKVNLDVDDGILYEYKAKSATAFDIQRTLDETFPELITNVLNPQSILAKEQLGESIQDEGGFYKIEISMNGVRSDLRGFNESGKVQSIVSKFYSQNSYTSAYNEGSIPYIHTSDEPLYLSDFRVRVLDPNNKLSTSIGDSNCVFLEVVKNSEVK